jgi:hypothetical protein
MPGFYGAPLALAGPAKAIGCFSGAVVETVVGRRVGRTPLFYRTWVMPRLERWIDFSCLIVVANHDAILGRCYLQRPSQKHHSNIPAKTIAVHCAASDNGSIEGFQCMNFGLWRVAYSV